MPKANSLYKSESMNLKVIVLNSPLRKNLNDDSSKGF